jgi:hypothetical protein
MGKFFLGGVFLGAAITWAVMTYVIGQGKRGEELDQFEEQVRLAAHTKGREEAAAEWRKRLEDETKKINDERTDERAKWAERIRALTGENQETLLKMEGVQEKLSIAQNEMQRLTARVEYLQKEVSKSSVASRQLLKLKTAMIDSQLRLWRTLGQSAAVLGQAISGWPDLELAQKSAAGLATLAKEYRDNAEKARVFIEQQSKALGEELGTDLEPYREGAKESDIKRLEKLSDTILEAVGQMKNHAVTVQADNDGWTDTEVLVKVGDVIHVRAEGKWRMNDNWQPSGPEGWDGGSQYKVSQEARAGGLILRIGISDKEFPAYLGKPIIATAPGRVTLRINDKETKDNVGSAKAEVVSCNPKLLTTVMELWDEATKGKK